MRPLRILTWHIHGSYLQYLSSIRHEIFLPVKPDRPTGYGGPAYLGASHAPFVIDADPNAPNFSVPDLVPPPAIAAGRLDDRKQLLEQVDRFHRAADGTVKIERDTVPVEVGASFRTRSPRVVSLASLSQQIAAANGGGDVDSAEMGFAMTEGVGMVSFLRRRA